MFRQKFFTFREKTIWFIPELLNQLLNKSTNSYFIMGKLFLYLMAAFYIFAGVSHFRKPWFYLKMMPSYMPAHQPVVFWSGVIEIILGIGLIIPATQHWAAWGIILLLIAVFPANINMALNAESFPKISPTFLWIRLPLQFLLIWWAYQYTK